MNFLQLANEVARESGTSGQSIPTVTGATGRHAKIIRWTAQAWEMIQRERRDWLFLRKTFSAPLTIGLARYAATDLGLTDFGGWERQVQSYSPFSLYDPALGLADERSIRLIPASEWFERYDRGTHDALRPADLAIDYERRLCLGPKPDKAYTLRGAYRRKIQVLALDADEPYIPEDFHAAIVWRALMLLGDDDEATFEVGSSSQQYALVRSAMLREFTESITL